MKGKEYIFLVLAIGVLLWLVVMALIPTDNTIKLRFPPLTVSGFSSGAAMAATMHIAHSKYIEGSALFAGPAYFCTLGETDRDAMKRCRFNSPPINLDRVKQ